MFYIWRTLLNLVAKHTSHHTGTLLWKWEKAGSDSRPGSSLVQICPLEPKRLLGKVSCPSKNAQ